MLTEKNGYYSEVVYQQMLQLSQGNLVNVKNFTDKRTIHNRRVLLI